MFSSLDRVDIELKPGSDGRRQFVQTDHRTVMEMECQPDLSVVFALIRILNPMRMGEAGSPTPHVIYSAHELPPAFLQRPINAAGASLVVGDDFRHIPGVEDAPALRDVVESALSNLSRAVAAEFTTTLDLDGLSLVEQSLAERASDSDENEFAYWSAVVKLGSFAGEVIRASNGGRWIIAESGTLPIALLTRFRGEEARVNPLGKAIKRFANGEEDSLVALVNAIRSQP